MFNRYMVAAALVMCAVVLSYVIRFIPLHGYEFSNDSAIWGQFGDYVGGMLNPVLSFISLILLIKSLTLQNEANQDLRRELKENEKTEKMRSFSILFFNMIASQKTFLENLNIVFPSGVKRGVGAIINVEDTIDDLRAEGKNDDEIREYLEAIDSEDLIFGILRAFYITVKVVSDKLSDSNGFDHRDRRDYFLTLVNFTDFAQLRLIVLSVQFMKYEATKFIRESHEFCSVLDDVGLKLDPY